MHEAPMSNVSRRKALLAFLRGHPRLTATVVIVLLSLGAMAGGLALGTWRYICHNCPSIAQIHVWEPTQSTKIFSHDGILIQELGIERRTQVALEHLPPYVPQAFIAIEDRRFYEHGGFDLRGIARAAIGLLVLLALQVSSGLSNVILGWPLLAALGHTLGAALMAAWLTRLAVPPFNASRSVSLDEPTCPTRWSTPIRP